MKQVFNNATPETKLTILEFLKEERISSFFKFKREGSEYLQEKYEKIYKSFLLGTDGNLKPLLAIPTSIDKEKNTFRVMQLRYDTGDAETAYDDSSVVRFTCSSCPNGIELDLPLHIIEAVDVFRIL